MHALASTCAHKGLKPHVHANPQPPVSLWPVDLTAAFLHVLGKKRMTFLVGSIVCRLSISSGPLAPAALFVT